MNGLIFLTGMPGAGKTYWGKRLSAYYHWPHTDMDEQLEHITGRTIPDLFREQGELFFREQEQQVLKQIITHHERPCIVSCGGGTPLFFRNMEEMKQEGTVIYLQAQTETLLDHLARQPGSRPLLGDEGISEKLEALLHARDKIYRQAHYIFNAERLTEANFAQIFAVCTNRH